MFESKLNKGKNGGYAGLDGKGKMLLENSIQDNFSREINICEENLSGIGSLEEQIVEYLISIEYTKNIFDTDVMIIVDTCGSGGSGGFIGIGLSNLN